MKFFESEEGGTSALSTCTRRFRLGFRFRLRCDELYDDIDRGMSLL